MLGEVMIYKEIDDRKLLVRIPKDKLDDLDIFDKDKLEKFVKKVVVMILKKKKIKGLVYLDIYIDNWYGMVMEFDVREVYLFDNQIDMKISFHIMNSFLYEMDYLMMREIGVMDEVVYYWNKKFYLEIINEIDNKLYMQMLEGARIRYKDNEKIKKGIIINI